VYCDASCPNGADAVEDVVVVGVLVDVVVVGVLVDVVDDVFVEFEFAGEVSGLDSAVKVVVADCASALVSAAVMPACVESVGALPPPPPHEASNMVVMAAQDIACMARRPDTALNMEFPS